VALPPFALNCIVPGLFGESRQTRSPWLWRYREWLWQTCREFIPGHKW